MGDLTAVPRRVGSPGLPILAIAASVFAGAPGAGCRDAAETRGAARADAPSDIHYAHLVGQRYRTRVDLYLFAFTDDPDRPYLGLNDGVRPHPPDLPRGVDRRHVGRTYGDLAILDVVPAGSVLTITAETHEVTAASGIRDKAGYPMGFITRLEYAGRPRAGVLAEFIQAGEPAPFRTPNQRLDEAVAERTGD